MQVIRIVLLTLFAAWAFQANAQVQQARGNATVSYQGKSAPAEVQANALREAELKAIETYYAESGQSESEGFDAIRDKVIANHDRFILESTVLSESDNPAKQQYTVAVRVSLNVANLRNAEKSNSAVTRTARSERSSLAFLVVSREVDSTKTYDARVFSRVDAASHGNAAGAKGERTTEGEHIGKGQVATNAASELKVNVSATTSTTRETGGSTTRKASDSTWRLIPSANLNQVFTSNFTRANFKVNEAAVVEPYTGGAFKVATLENDYRSGNDLKSATLQSIVVGMRNAHIPYFALASLDVGMAGTDPQSGLVRVSVTVNAKVMDVTQPIPETLASVGPVVYAGVGPSEDEARAGALKLAANNAARDLATQLVNLGLK